MEPMTMFLLASAVANGLSAAGGAISNRENRRQSAAENEKDREAAAARALQETALAESGQDPFRHSLSQLNAAETADKIQNTRQKTVSIPGMNPKFMPTLGGGYQASDSLRRAAGNARQDILMGTGQAPTQTDPYNYGQTGIRNLTTPGASNSLQSTAVPPPVTIGGQGQAPTMTMDLLAMLRQAGLIPPATPMPGPQAGQTPLSKIGPGQLPGAAVPPGGGAEALRMASQRGSRPRIGTQPAGDPFALSF